jgi:predicted TPR repeat methyltransferase
MLKDRTNPGAQEYPGADLIATLRDRLLLAPQDSAAMAELAGLLEAAGDLPGAIDLYQRALRVDPYAVDIVLRLGHAWRALGDAGRARSWFARALAIDPDCAEAGAELANATGDALTPAYIRTLFDQYAERFDQELTGTLGYRAPQLVAAALGRQGLADGSADILDIGCGTGLSGLALRRFARRLDGVDLSPGMIARALARSVYDAVFVGDALGHLSGDADAWDIVTAVDMLNYVGDLAGLFATAASSLRPGGLLAGTVEKGASGVALTYKRRYAHGADHLRAALSAAGLDLLDLTEEVLRNEGGIPVPGLIFVAHRPEAKSTQNAGA